MISLIDKYSKQIIYNPKFVVKPPHEPMTTQLTTGTKYSIKFQLGSTDRHATDNQVKQKFESVGFIDVKVSGENSQREVEAKWAGVYGEFTLQEQINSIEPILEA